MELIKTETIVGNVINVYGTNDKPLFLAKDVAEWLEHSNVSSMISKLDQEEVTKFNLGGLKGETNFLTEYGVYEVLMQSRKPRAKQFKKWVKDILQDIRKTGMYATDQLLDNPDLMIQAMEKLKEERAKRKALENKIQEDAPRVGFAETIEKAADDILFRDMSKILSNEGVKLGERKLYDWCRDKGLIFKNSTKPTQKASDKGLFRVDIRVIKTVKGDRETFTTKITGKGQIYLLNKIKKEIEL